MCWFSSLQVVFLMSAPGKCSNFILGLPWQLLQVSCVEYPPTQTSAEHPQLNVPTLNICKVSLFHMEIIIF